MRIEKLTALEFKFVNNYLNNGLCAYRAALDAGYAESSARTRSHKMLQKPHIRAVLDERLKKIEKKVGLTRERKLKALSKAVEKGLPEEGELEDKQWAGIALEALKEANKMQGDHAAEKHVTVNLHTDVDVAELKETLIALESKHKRDY